MVDFWYKIKDPYLKVGFVIFTITHFLIGSLYAFKLDTLTFINDPKDFFEIALNSQNFFSAFGLGHQFMAFIIYPFVKTGMNIETIFLVFSFISYLGFLNYFELLKIYNLKKYNKLLLLVFLLPTPHIWLASLSKEVIIFYAMSIVLKEVINGKYGIKILISLLFIFLVRPHMSLLIFISILLSFLLGKDLSMKQKIYYLGGVGLMSFLMIYLTSKYFLKIEDINIQTVLEYVYDFYNSRITKKVGGSAIDVKNTSLLERMFFLLFMPLPFLYNITNVFQLCSSLENTVLLVCFFVFMYSSLMKKMKSRKLNLRVKVFLYSNVLITIVFFSSYLYNLGLGNRMRIMFLPYVFYIIIKETDLNSLFNRKLKS